MKIPLIVGGGVELLYDDVDNTIKVFGAGAGSGEHAMATGPTGPTGASPTGARGATGPTGPTGPGP